MQFWWRIKVDGFSDRQFIGDYNRSIRAGDPEMVGGGYSVHGAFRRAEEMAREDAEARLAGAGNRRAVAAAREAEEVAAREADRQAAEYTLGALLDDYVAYLVAGSASPRTAVDARNLFKNHIPDNLKALPANAITGDHLVAALRVVNKQGKARTTDKVRAYVLAAYNVAIKARRNPKVSERLAEYGIHTNPAADTDKVQPATNADKNPLPIEDLRRYWQAIRKIEGLQGAALRAHLLLGGQRIEQLVRAKASDLRGDTLRLVDVKGKRQPREHLIPLPATVAGDLAALATDKKPEDWLFSTDGGKTHLDAGTLGDWGKAAAATAPAFEGGEVGIAGFQVKRIRSGVETLLASQKVSLEARAQLQSHGLGGVQAKHYDAHDYRDEKAHALAILERELSRTSDKPAPGANVVRLKARRA